MVAGEDQRHDIEQTKKCDPCSGTCSIGISYDNITTLLRSAINYACQAAPVHSNCRNVATNGRHVDGCPCGPTKALRKMREANEQTSSKVGTKDGEINRPITAWWKSWLKSSDCRWIYKLVACIKLNWRKG